MITWGQKVNTNKQQVQSLGAVATGDVHTFTRFRTAPDGASLHPMQRSGHVSSASHGMGVKHSAFSGSGGLGGSVYPASHVDMQLPPVAPVGQARFMVA
jgi:hypothetical protein